MKIRYLHESTAKGSNFILLYIEWTSNTHTPNTSQLSLREREIVGMHWRRQQVSMTTDFANSSMLHMGEYWGVDMQEDC